MRIHLKVPGSQRWLMAANGGGGRLVATGTAAQQWENFELNELSGQPLAHSSLITLQAIGLNWQPSGYFVRVGAQFVRSSGSATGSWVYGNDDVFVQRGPLNPPDISTNDGGEERTLEVVRLDGKGRVRNGDRVALRISGKFYLRVTDVDGAATVDARGEAIGADSTFELEIINDAEFVNWSNIPTRLESGSLQMVQVTFRNTGWSRWRGSDQHSLGTQAPDDNTLWSESNRIPLPQEVPPGNQVTFGIQITAPQKAGLHRLQWRMVQDSVEWFGDPTPVQEVLVGCRMKVFTDPHPVRLNNPITLTVHAVDESHPNRLVAGTVHITNYNLNGSMKTIKKPTNSPFEITLRLKRVKGEVDDWPSAFVEAPGCENADVDFGF
jgi:hypothetical protein